MIRFFAKRKMSGFADFDHIFKVTFSPDSRPFIHRSFLVSLFFLGAWFSGRMFAHLLEPSPVAPRSAPLPTSAGGPLAGQMVDIQRVDLFNTVGGDVAVANAGVGEEELVCDQAENRSSLPYKLLNTIVLQDSVKSIASVQVRSKVKMLREGERLEDLVVGKISRLKVIFANTKERRCEFIERQDRKGDRVWSKRKPNILSPKKGREVLRASQYKGITQEGDKFTIKKAVRSEMLKDLNKIVMDALAVPMKNPDGSICFKMTEIVPGSFYSQMGVENEDVICNINGQKVKDMSQVMNLFGKIREIDQFELSIKRDGQEIAREYNFE